MVSDACVSCLASCEQFHRCPVVYFFCAIIPIYVAGQRYIISFGAETRDHHLNHPNQRMRVVFLVKILR